MASPQLVQQTVQPVTVIDLDMKFWSMVTFMVKWSLASIPAFLILVVFGLGVAVFAAGFLRAIFH